MGENKPKLSKVELVGRIESEANHRKAHNEYRGVLLSILFALGLACLNLQLELPWTFHNIRSSLDLMYILYLPLEYLGLFVLPSMGRRTKTHFGNGLYGRGIYRITFIAFLLFGMSLLPLVGTGELHLSFMIFTNTLLFIFLFSCLFIGVFVVAQFPYPFFNIKAKGNRGGSAIRLIIVSVSIAELCLVMHLFNQTSFMIFLIFVAALKLLHSLLNLHVHHIERLDLLELKNDLEQERVNIDVAAMRLAGIQSGLNIGDFIASDLKTGFTGIFSIIEKRIEKGMIELPPIGNPSSGEMDELFRPLIQELFEKPKHKTEEDLRIVRKAGVDLFSKVIYLYKFCNIEWELLGEILQNELTKILDGMDKEHYRRVLSRPYTQHLIESTIRQLDHFRLQKEPTEVVDIESKADM